jgi:hypothetical protein
MKELDKIQNAIINANEEFEKFFLEENAYEELVISYCQEAYLSLLTFVDKNNLSGLHNYLNKEWKKYEKDLIASTYSDVAEMTFLRVTYNLLYPVYISLCNIYEKHEEFDDIEQNDSFSLSNMLEYLPHTATKIYYSVQDESSMDALIEAFLIPIYPDLNSNPSLSLPEGHRQPDSAIPSLNLLLEYKFLKSKNEIGKIIDEIQADIRNYAHSDWKYLYIIIGMNKAYSTKDKFEKTLLKEPTTFKGIRIILLRF